ncbi:MAG: hypothetical protein KBS84_07435 [Treponema sp.]|nr:hypothetical protein [Candidatus Treponema scatequi]
MPLFERILSAIGKSKYTKENIKAAEDSIKTLKYQMDLLNQKAFNLAENYPEQKKKIADCFSQVNSIEPSTSVRAGKFEQAISVAITKVSTSCDKIFTSKDQKHLDEEIKALAKAIRERINADKPVLE